MHRMRFLLSHFVDSVEMNCETAVHIVITAERRYVNMVCPKCGRNLPKGSKFCQYCGIKIKQQQLINIKSINVFLAIGFVFLL